MIAVNRHPGTGARRRLAALVVRVGTAALATASAFALPGSAAGSPPAAPAAAPTAAQAPGASTGAPSPIATCLPSGDGYLRARLAGAIEARIDWPNSGTRCQGEPKRDPRGVRLSFERLSGGKPNLLFVFGLTEVAEGRSAHAVGTNLTLIVQGTPRIFGTLGDGRCTVDSLTQTPLPAGPHVYRLEARGFCTQPAHAVRGPGAVLVSTFEFAGIVDYADESGGEDTAEPPTSTGLTGSTDPRVSA